jgi:outer membrane protein assembly factor BamB
MADSPMPDLSTVASPPRQPIEYTELTDAREPIGAGGQAVVYEATLPGGSPPDRVALKEPSNPGTLDYETVETFLEEAATWETVDRRERQKPRWADSEYIVGVIDTGEELPWIAMEYMDGGGLDDRLDQHPGGLPLAEALWIGESICRGVELAHNYGIAHLDLKPANVLFRATPDDTWDLPKVADWGLARVLAEQTGTMEGLSVSYAAPEQFEPDEFGDPDMLTDVYQVGALVYALLTGEPPYTGSQLSVLRDVVDGDESTPPSAHRSDVPGALDSAVQIALARSKTDRYRNIATFAQALRAIRTGQALPPVVSRHAGTTGTVTVAEPADFEVLITSVDAVTEGETTTVAYEVTNTGDQQDTQEIEFSVNGMTAGTEAGVTLNGSETLSGQFTYDTVRGDKPGLKVSVASSDGTATETVTVEPLRITAPWPMFQGDPARTGYHPRVTGPSQTVNTQWTVDTGGSVRSSPAVANGIVYIGSRDNSVYALDATDGTTQWTVDTGGSVWSSPAVANGTVYVGSDDHSVYALDATDGTTQWTADTGASVYSSPAVANGTAYVGSYDHSVYALDANDGIIQWTADTDSIVESSPVVAEGTVYVGSNDNSVYAIDASDGTTQWTVDTGGSVHSSPAVAEGTVYVGSYDNSVYALDASGGTTQWTADTGGSVHSSPAVAEGTVYFGSNDNSVYAIDASDGTTQWTADTGGLVHSSPAVAEGTVYVGSYDNSVYALDATDGTAQWTVYTGDRVGSSPAVAEGTVYVGSRDNSVYAIE